MPAKDALTILFYPAFDNNEEFVDHYYRMLWYLNPLQDRIRHIVVPYEGDPPSVGALPYYLDPAIKQIESGIAHLVDLVSSEHTSLLENAAREADIVLVWRAGTGLGNRLPDGPLKHVVMKKRHYFVDHKHERYAGSFYLRLSAEICNTDATVMECSEKFKRIPADSFSKIGYIYGTGPSLQTALEMDLSDGTSIICNTIVKNRELMRKLKPPIIAVADPIFHTGCSSYAGDFRRHLLEAMIEYDSYLIVPMRDYALYMANMDSSLRERIIGIPIVPPNIAPGQMPNLNLYKKFQVTPATSILMLFLIPLAATFFEKTFILGCDGRPLDQDDYFWKHDPASQLVDRMDDIQVAHPAFFKIDYHDFYLEHCRVVARWLDEAERQGKHFFGLTPSYIPALKSRYAPPHCASVELRRSPVEGQVHIISLNPHFIDAFGHFLAYDTKLRSACVQRGVEFISAANSRVDHSLIKSHPYVRAVFTDISYTSGVTKGNKEPAALEVERFRREVEDFVDEYLGTCKPGDRVILYLYTGGPRHIEMLYEIIKGRPQVSAHINFFFVGSTHISDQAFRERWTETLRKSLLEESLAVTVPTHEMQSEVQEAAQVVLPVAPAPSTTFDDIEAMSALEQSNSHLVDNTENATCNVLFPGLMREAKGYALAVSVIRTLHQRQPATRYQCTLRYAPRRNTPSELTNIAKEARRFANVVEGILPPEEFQRMLKEADIIVLPYQPSDFSNRTSGLLIDALLSGVPAVVQEDTWLGNMVARYDCGALVEMASPEAYVKAIEQVAADYHRYQKNAIIAGEKWLADNNWAALFDFILAPPSPTDISQDAIAAKPQEKTPSAAGKVASGATMPMKGLAAQARSCATSTDSPATPSVSIVMPAFNAANFIDRAIKSVQAQSLTDWELLVIDDGSTDDTREVVAGLAEADSRIRLLQCKGKGVSDARNTGLDAARGDFMTFLDADDFMYPDALKRRVEALIRNPGWNLVHCVTEIVDGNSRKLGWQLGRLGEVSFKDMSENPWHLNSVMGRSEVFKSVRFQSGLTNGEDWLFFSDILRSGEVSYRTDNCSVAYVIRRDSVVCRDYLSHEGKVLEVLNMIYSPARNNLPAASEFVQGLSSPPKEVVALRRKLGLLTWLLLEQRASDATALLSELRVHSLSTLRRSEIRNQIIYPGMRFYICRQEELPKRFHKDKAPILKLLSQTGIAKVFPPYAHEFKLSMGKASTNKVKSVIDRVLYRRLVDYLMINYPMIITIGRFAKWSLAKLKRTFFGIGGIFLLVVAGLYVAGALIEPVRWYLVGTATALLLLGGGLLALFYARFILNRFVSDQHQLSRDTRTTLAELARGIKTLERETKTLERETKTLEREIKTLEGELTVTKHTLAKLNVGNFPLFQQLNRRLTDEDLKRFAGEWAPKLGLNLNVAALGYMAHRICLAEDTCIGRLAGNIETMVLRVLVARSVKEPSLEVLEIGTLFGVGVAMIHESCRGLFSTMHFTVIDPLIGHIGLHDKTPLDGLTKAPATREIFIHNMQRMNIPQSDYTLIEKLSTEDAAIEEASKTRYNLLIIDGDHSDFGVKHDFFNYRHLVKRGGYIIFDDYGNPRWPGLTDFVDKEVAGQPELEFVGTDVFSAVFRVVAPQDLTRQSATTAVTVTTKDESRAGAPSPALTGRDTAANPSFDYPKQVSLETSATCNAHCDFCPQSKLARRGHVMQMGLIEKIVSELAEIPPSCSPEIALNGVNEPLADKRISIY